MRAIAVALILLLASAILTMKTPVQAETSDACKQCGTQQQACKKNYPAKTCKTEYDICMKSCQKK